MATKVKHTLDLDQNQIINTRIENRAFTPLSPLTGQIIFNTAINSLLIYNGSSWISLDGTFGTLQEVLTQGNETQGSDIIITAPSDRLVFTSNSGRNFLQANPLSGNTFISLQDKSGTLALLTDITTIVDITYIDLKSLQSGNTLEPGITYHITDRDIWILALDTNLLSTICRRKMPIVKDEFYTPHNVSDDQFLGIYGQTYNQGSVPNSQTGFNGIQYYVIWGGKIWQRHTTGSDTKINDSTLGSGWVVVNSGNTEEYDQKIFTIEYNFDDDIVWTQSDDRGNVIKNFNNSTFNIDVTDWGNSKIVNNECYGVFNNFQSPNSPATISNNSNNGVISNNSNSSVISGNNNNGDINNNTNTGSIYSNFNTDRIYNNSNGGNIINNSNAGYIQSNSNNGYIQSNSNLGVIYNNSNTSYIKENHNTGDITLNNSNVTFIADNSNGGYIKSNSNNGKIESNSNAGYIQSNSNNGQIAGNSNAYYIYNNSNNGGIYFNSNRGMIYYNRSAGTGDTNIYNNSNIGDISYNNMNSPNPRQIIGNSNNGKIYNNSVCTHIEGNSNNGEISNNSSSNTSYNTFITNNSNNGWIMGNRGLSFVTKIEYNINNGSIGVASGTTDKSGTISDSIVNK